VTFDDWLLVLHVLSAFAYVAGVTLFWVLVVAVRRTDTPEGTTRMEPSVKIGTAVVGIGSIGAIVFGIWLALSLDRYDLWDGWIIAAIVLWAIAAELGRRTGNEYTKGMRKAEELQGAGRTEANADLLALNRTSTGLLLQSVTSLVLLLILIDMIWKPGA
jgi:uncharacterized membrane protein